MSADGLVRVLSYMKNTEGLRIQRDDCRPRWAVPTLSGRGIGAKRKADDERAVRFRNANRKRFRVFQSAFCGIGDAENIPASLWNDIPFDFRAPVLRGAVTEIVSRDVPVGLHRLRGSLICIGTIHGFFPENGGKRVKIVF